MYFNPHGLPPILSFPSLSFEKLGAFDPILSHSLDFAHFTAMVQFSIFLCPLFSCELIPKSRGLLRS